MSNLDDRLEPIRRRFRARLAADAQYLRSLLQASSSPERDAEIGMIVHKIAGFAGTVGLAELGRAAKHLDDAFSSGRISPSTGHRHWERFIDALDHESAAGE